MNFDRVVKADLSWNTLVYALAQELLKFLLNATHNVPPTPDNLKRWGKTVADVECHLGGGKTITLKHFEFVPNSISSGSFHLET